MDLNINFNELDLQNYHTWPTPVKAVAIIILCLLLLFMGYWLDTSSQLQSLKVARQQEVELKQQFEVKQRQASNLKAYREQVKELEQRLNDLLTSLPERTEVPALLEEISKLGVSNGLEFILIKPLPIEEQDFYAELPIQIQVLGDYHEFAKFISDVASLKRVVILSDYDIKAASAEALKKANITTAKHPLEMTITAKTYWYTGVEQGAQEGANAKKP